MKSGRKLNIIISTALLGLFLYLAFRNVNLGELFDILANTNYLYVILGSSIGVVLGSVVRAWRWSSLLDPVKKGIPYISLFSTTVIGYMVNNLIPRSGEFVRPYLLGKREGISRASAFGTIIIERIIDTVTFLLFFGFTLLFFKDRISGNIPNIDVAILTLSGLTILLSFWILFMIFKTELSFKIIKFFTKFLPVRFHPKIEKIFNSLVNGFNVIKKPSLFIRIAFQSLLLWMLYLLSTYVPFLAFDIMTDIPLRDALWNANILLVLINVAMFIPAPAATGPYHYICKLALVNIFFIPEAKALGYATATHIIAFLIYLVLGLYYFISFNYKLSEIQKESELING